MAALLFQHSIAEERTLSKASLVLKYRNSTHYDKRGVFVVGGKIDFWSEVDTSFRSRTDLSEVTCSFRREQGLDRRRPSWKKHLRV